MALESGVAHDLILGIALQVSGRYYNWTQDVREGVILEEQEHFLTAAVQGRSRAKLNVRFERSGEDESQPTGH